MNAARQGAAAAEGVSRPADSKAKLAAAVQSTRLETLAGEQHASALLRSVRASPTFDEVHRHDGQGSSRATTVDGESDEDLDGGSAVITTATIAPQLSGRLGSPHGSRRHTAVLLPQKAATPINASNDDIVDFSIASDLTQDSSSLSPRFERSGDSETLPSMTVDVDDDDDTSYPAPALHQAWQGIPPPQVPDASPTAAQQLQEVAWKDSQSLGADLPLPSSTGHTKASQDRLKGFTGVFGEVMVAFRQLQAEKRTLEKVIRATTPLDGLGEGNERFIQYLTSVQAKAEASASEIQKLLALLLKQREVMDYMLETHEDEIDSHLDEIDDLREELQTALQTTETHRNTSSSLQQKLDNAQAEAFAARQELLKAKRGSSEQAAEREQVVRALETSQKEMQARQVEIKAAHEQRQQLQAAYDALQTSHQALQSRQTELTSSLETSNKDMSVHAETIADLKGQVSGFQDAQEELTARLMADHEREIWNLKEEHENTTARTNAEIEEAAERLLAMHNDALAVLQDEHNQTIDQLEARAHALESSHEALNTAKRDLMGKLDLRDEETSRLRSELQQAVDAGKDHQLRTQQAEMERDALKAQLEEQALEISRLKARSSTSSRGREEQPSTPPIFEDHHGILPPFFPSTTSPVTTPINRSALDGEEDGSPSAQIRHLTSQLQDQRAREAQIRSAYKQLRDEHRRLQTSSRDSTATARPRETLGSGLTLSTGFAGNGASRRGSLLGSSPVHDFALLPATRDAEDGTPTKKQLKRLSLPAATRLSDVLGSASTSPPQQRPSSGIAPRPESVSSSPGVSHPPGSFRARHIFASAWSNGNGSGAGSPGLDSEHKSSAVFGYRSPESTRQTKSRSSSLNANTSLTLGENGEREKQGKRIDQVEEPREKMQTLPAEETTTP